MKREKNAQYIYSPLYTCAHARGGARVSFLGEAIFPACVNCRFFHQQHELPIAGAAPSPDLIEGECRREAPVVGELLTDHHGETFRHYGEWPRVLGSDWCGRHEAMT